MARWIAVWPAALWVLLVGFAGGVESGTRPVPAALGLAAIVLTALAGASALLDPLGVGHAGRWLLGALVVTVGASWWVSEMPRAGLVGVLLLPSFLLLPAATARLVGGGRARRVALGAWGAGLAALSFWAVACRLQEGASFAGAPLGDRNLLAMVVAVALPFAALGWRHGGIWRGIAALSSVCGLAAVVAADSVAGELALAAALGVAAWRGRAARGLLLGAGLLALAASVPELELALHGEDPAIGTRLSFAAADWKGALERPWLGWGPGSASWVVGALREPVPGAEAEPGGLGAPHATPLLLAFELGLPAAVLLLALAVAFAKARWRRAAADDGGLADAGFASMAAAVVGFASGSWLASPALPSTVAIGAGFLLASQDRSAGSRARLPVFVLAGAWTALVVWQMAPLVSAASTYQAARDAAEPAQRQELLELASRRDPGHPLYRAQRAWSGRGEAWREVVEAAASARGVGSLWLRAATMANRNGRIGVARLAAAQTLAIEPHAAAPAWLLHVLTPGDIRCAARAMLAEPRLAAAARWRGRERERHRALAEVETWPGVDARWKEEFLRQAGGANPRSAEGFEIVIRFDGERRRSPSARIFRRPPWPVEILRIRVDRAAARRVTIRPATAVISSSAAAFPRRRCRPSASR